MIRRIACVAATLFCLIHSAHAQAPVTIRYGQNAAGAKGISSLPLNVAIRKQFSSA